MGKIRTLWDLVWDRPNEDWDTSGLSSNMAINISDIFANPNGPPGRIGWQWQIDQIAVREDVTWEMITSDYNPWKHNSLFHKNPNITWKNIMDSIKNNWPHKWKSSEISSNPNITWKIMLDNPYGPYKDPHWKWDFCGVCSNECITFDNIYNNLHKLNIYYEIADRWNFVIIDDDVVKKQQYIIDYMSDHISLSIIVDNIDYNWDWNTISIRDDLEWSFIKIAIDNDKELNWDVISMSSAVTWDNIMENLHLPWSWMYVSHNPNITFDIFITGINEHIIQFDMLMCFYNLSNNPNIDINIIKKYPDGTTINLNNIDKLIYNWDYNEISISPNITIKDIVDNPNIPWNYKAISCNEMNYWFSSNYNRRKLAKKTSNAIKDELENRVFHPSNHPGNYMSIDELKDHPLIHHTPQEVKLLYIDKSVRNINIKN